MTHQDSRVLAEVKRGVEYRLIKRFYGVSRAERSQVLKMNHIDEGLAIMDYIGASTAAMQAYCLHPIFQHNDQLCSDGYAAATTPGLNPLALMLTMEYRARANDFLSGKVDLKLALNDFPHPKPDWGVLAEVKHMLIADKVQNYKDFMLHHSETHERKLELKHYFELWHATLSLPSHKVRELIRVAEAVQHQTT